MPEYNNARVYIILCLENSIRATTIIITILLFGSRFFSLSFFFFHSSRASSPEQARRPRPATLTSFRVYGTWFRQSVGARPFGRRDLHSCTAHRSSPLPSDQSARWRRVKGKFTISNETERRARYALRDTENKKNKKQTRTEHETVATLPKQNVYAFYCSPHM